MGTLIQGYQPGEKEFRGDRFADWDRDVKGNSDLLNLTQPDMIREIHRKYLDAGADILETNTFTATSIAQADYGMEELAYEINQAGAEIAREARRRGRHRRPTRGSSRAPSARPTGPRRSRPTSTTPAPATCPTRSSWRRTSTRPAAWSTAAPTCC